MPGDAAIEYGALAAWCVASLALGVNLTALWGRPRLKALGLSVAAWLAVGALLFVSTNFMGAGVSDEVFFTAGAFSAAVLVGAAALLVLGAVVVLVRRPAD